LFEKFNEKLVIRCLLNENDENKMRFKNLIKQTLQLTKSRSVIIKTRKTNYKIKKTTTLMKEMKSIIKKNVNEHFINLLKIMKSQIEESILEIDIKFDDLIEIMKKITINVNNLINCIFFLNDQDNSKSS
jgi:homospermidine synthase